MPRLEDVPAYRAAVAARARHTSRLEAIDADAASATHRLRYLRRLLPILERQTIDAGGDIWSLREREDIAALEATLDRLGHERQLQEWAREVADWRQLVERVRFEAAEQGNGQGDGPDDTQGGGQDRPQGS